MYKGQRRGGGGGDNKSLECDVQMGGGERFYF